MSAHASGPEIYLVDDVAAELQAEMSRHLASTGRLHTGAPGDPSGAVLVGGALALDTDALRSASGVLLLPPTLAERDRVQLALAGREHVWLEIVSDPAVELAAERALGLLLRLAMERRGAPVSQGTVGLLGFRALGWKLAALLGELGATVHFWSPEKGARDLEEQRKHALRSGARPAPFDELLRASDTLIVDLPDEPSSEPYIGRAELALMRDDVLLVNTTSATAVDDGALIQALRGGYLGGVGLARTNLEPLPPESPLHSIERVVLSPAPAGEDRDLARRMLAARVARALAGHSELHLEARRVRHVARRRSSHRDQGSDTAKGRG